MSERHPAAPGPRPRPVTRVVRSPERATPAVILRRATEALRVATEVDHEWTDQETSEVAAAVAEHLLAVVAVLPPEVPGWLLDWQRLARRHGVLATPTPAGPLGGVAALTDLKVRLDQVAHRAEQYATRQDRTE